MIFKELRCQLTSENGTVCGRYLADLEAGKVVTIRFKCPEKHLDGARRIEFCQDKDGIIQYSPIDGNTEKKSYNDDGVRIQKCSITPEN
jgi:hypothetical protein